MEVTKCANDGTLQNMATVHLNASSMKQKENHWKEGPTVSGKVVGVAAVARVDEGRGEGAGLVCHGGIDMGDRHRGVLGLTQVCQAVETAQRLKVSGGFVKFHSLPHDE